MEKFIVETINAIIINLISNDLETIKENWINKFRLKLFVNKNKKWLNDFYKKCDGTIVLTDAFADHLEYHKPIEEIYNFVFGLKYEDKTEQQFIKELVDNCKDSITYTGKVCNVQDELIIKELFEKILQNIKAYIETSLSSDQMYMLYQQKKATAEVIKTVKEDGANNSHKLDQILKILEKQKNSISQDIIVEVYIALNEYISKGEIDFIYKLLPVLESVNEDLELGIKCILQIVSKYQFVRLDVIETIDIISVAEIRNDIIRKLLLYNFNNKDILKKISGKASSKQLNRLIKCVIEEEFQDLFIQNIQEVNYAKIYNVELNNTFNEEVSLVRKITFLYFCNQPIHITQEMLKALLGDNIDYVEELLLDDNMLYLSLEQNDNNQIEEVYNSLKEKKDLYERTCDNIQEKYYSLLLRSMLILNPKEINQFKNEIPKQIKERDEIENLLFQGDIRNENVTETQLIEFCVQKNKYVWIIYYLVWDSINYQAVIDFFEKYSFLLEKDIQVFSLYVLAIERKLSKEKAINVLLQYKPFYKDYVEYWIDTLRVTMDKTLVGIVMENWLDNKLQSSSVKADEDLANVLLNLECYDEVEILIRKLETIGKITPLIKRMQSAVLISKKQYIDALNVLMEIFEYFKEDPYVVNNILTLAIQNKRTVKENVLDAAININTADTLMKVAYVYQNNHREAEASILLKKALLQTRGDNYDVYNMFLGQRLHDGKTIPELTCVDANSTVILKTEDGNNRTYCIYKEDVLPYEPYMWEESEHIYFETAIQLGLVRKQVGDEIVLSSTKYVVDNIMALETYLFGICMDKLIAVGRVKAFSVGSNEEDNNIVESLTKWIKDNMADEKESYAWLEQYKNKNEIALPFYVMKHFTNLSLEQFILIMLEDSSIFIRELPIQNSNMYDKYVLSFSAVIALFKIGVPIEYLTSKDVIVTESLLEEIKEETERIIESNNKADVSSIGVRDDKLFMMITTEEEKTKWMSDAINIKKYIANIKTQINKRDIRFNELHAVKLNEFLGVFDYDALSIAQNENCVFVSAEEFYTQLTQLESVPIESCGVLDFLCSLELESTELIQFMKKMTEYRFLVAINKTAIELIRNDYLQVNADKQEEIAIRWNEFLDSIYNLDSEYKERLIEILNTVVRQLEVEQIERNDYIIQCLAHYVIKYNNIKFEAYVNENFEIEVRAYREEQMISIIDERI